MLKLSLITAALIAPTWMNAPLGGGWVWDGANALGFAALAVMLVLGLDSGRGRGYRSHRALGWAAAFLALGHAAWFLVADPLLLEYLNPTAPMAMLVGIVALLLLLLLVSISGRGLRARLFRGTAFRTEHWWLAVLVVGLTAWHVAGTGFYLRDGFEIAVFLVIVGVLTAAPRLPSWRTIPEQTDRSAGVAVTQAAAATLLAFALLALPHNLGTT